MVRWRERYSVTRVPRMWRASSEHGLDVIARALGAWTHRHREGSELERVEYSFCDETTD